MCRLIKKILVHLLHSAHGWWGGRGGAMPRMCYYTYSTLEIGCHRVHLTDRWSAHLTRLSLHSLTAPDLKSIHNEIKWRGRRARLSVESKTLPSRPALMLQVRLTEITLPTVLHFVFRQDDAPSSSLCHVQSPGSSRLQMGCLSNTEWFDERLCPANLSSGSRGDAAGQHFHGDVRPETGNLDLQLGPEWLEFTHVACTPSIHRDSVYTLKTTAATSFKWTTRYVPLLRLNKWTLTLRAPAALQNSSPMYEVLATVAIQPSTSCPPRHLGVLRRENKPRREPLVAIQL